MTSPIRIAILENHQTTIDGYRFRLPAPEFEIVGVAEVYSRQASPLGFFMVRHEL